MREAGLSPKLLDELGDLLFQTTFLALLCEEAGAGAWVDVALGVAAKLRVRHPWVFGDASAESAGDARNRWEGVKVESEGREGIFHDVPERAAGAARGAQGAAPRRRRSASSTRPRPTRSATSRASFASCGPSCGEEPEPEREPLAAIVGEIGDVLFACVNVARRYNCDPELALRAATARFRERVEVAERLAEAEGVAFRAAGTPEQEHYYQAAKRSLREGTVTTIASVHARQILDSRGNPTVEVDVVTDAGALGRAAVPSGASTGSHEAVERRDGGSAYGGKAVEGAVASVNDELGPALLGHDVHDQRGVDRLLCEIDGTPDKGRIGANGVLGASLAVAKASAAALGLAALALARRAVGARPARAHDERHQRRGARGQRARPAGVHGRPVRREQLRRGPADRQRGLPRAQGAPAPRRPQHRRRRRGRVRARDLVGRGRDRAHPRRGRRRRARQRRSASRSIPP